MPLSMESATLSNPQRKSTIHQPVQKCQSLPSYAKAGGEGIDHRLIFAALEQKEKVRRKSKIFKDKEKSGSRQNYFCLPLTSNGRCKETSLSSDTSCSSVEYQKPKTPITKSKKHPCQQGHPGTELNPQKSKKLGVSLTTGCIDSAAGPAVKDTGCMSAPPPGDSSFITANGIPETTVESGDISKFSLLENGSLDRRISPNEDIERQKQTLDIPRNTIGSSDSLEKMERSSRSSNDSLSRRERREAVKARVEAEREKYIDTSSDEDNSSGRKAKYNSDGTGPRTVRDVKTRSLSRAERNNRRKSQSQDEPGSNKMRPKAAVSADADKFSIAQSTINKDFDGMAEFSLAQVLNDFEKPLQPLPKKIKVNDNLKLLPCRNFFLYDQETDDAKLRLSAALTTQKEDCNDVKFRGNPLESSESRKNILPKDQIVLKTSVESFCAKSVQNNQLTSVPQAPTPPPRSPKSMIFLNKMFLNQCKNMNVSVSNFMSKQTETSFAPGTGHSSIKSFNSPEKPEQSKILNAADYCLVARRSRDYMRSRRKTCSNFPCVDSLERGRFVGPYISQSLLEDFSTSNPNLSNRMSFGNFAANSKCSEPNSNFGLPWQQEKKVSLSDLHRHTFKYDPLSNLGNTCLSFGKKQCCSSLHKDCRHSKNGNEYSARVELTAKTSLGIPDEKMHASKSVSDRFEASSLESLDLPNVEASFVSPLKTYDRLSKSEANLLRHVSDNVSNTKLNTFFMNPMKSCYSSKDSSGEKLSSERPNGDIFGDKNRLRDESVSLECAMEELQNVYKSLNESISENKQANVVLGNERASNSAGIKLTLNPISQIHKNTNSEFEGTSPRKAFNSDISASYSSTSENSKNTVSSKTELKNCNDSKGILSPSLSEPLCIEELFHNLTMQLDFEQKALEETRMRKVSSPCPTSDTNSKKELIEIHPYRPSSSVLPKATKTLETHERSIVGLEKSFLDEPDNTPYAKQHIDVKQRCLPRKKRKAVRSYSANIANLLQPLDDAILSDTASLRAERPQSAALDCLTPEHETAFKLNGTGRSDALEVNDITKTLNPCRNQLNGDVRTTPRGTVGTEKSDTKLNTDARLAHERCLSPHKKSQEIWEIRVSMDPREKPGEANCSQQKFNTHSNLRLHSAVSQSKKDSQTQQMTAPHSIKRPTHMRSFSSVPLDDGELDRLLTSLLSDVSKVIDATTESTLSKNMTCAHFRPVNSSQGSMGGGKGAPENVKATRGPCSSKMDKCLSSQNGGKLEENEARNINLHYYSQNLENSSRMLDNDTCKNNNAEMPSSSFLQTSTENTVTSPCIKAQESFIKHNREQHPHSLQRSRQAHLPPCKSPFSVTHGDKSGGRNQNVRRHSVGGEDMRTEEINYRCGSFFTLEKRFQTIAHPTNPSCQSPSWKALCNSQNEYNSTEKRSSQVSESTSSINEKQPSSAIILKTPPAIEKPKDKSYKRKSSLNRVDFVQTSPSVAGGDSNFKQSAEPKAEFCTSDENECGVSQDMSRNIPSPISVKRKNQQAQTKDAISAEKQTTEGSVKQKTPHHWRIHRGLLKAKNSKALGLEKRSHSAGEQESPMDYSENGCLVNPCLSAQEIDYYHHQNLHSVNKSETNYDLDSLSQSLMERESSWHFSTASHEIQSAPRHIHLSCDTTTSHIEPVGTTPRSGDELNYFSEVTLNDDSLVHRSEVELIIDSHVKDTGSSALDDGKVKSDSMGSDGVASDHSTGHGGFLNSIKTICGCIENSLKLDENNLKDDKNNSSVDHFVREHHSDCEVSISSYKTTLFPISHSDPEERFSENKDGLGMVEVNQLSHSEKDLSRQPSSILRRHHHEERRGLQGILKHSGDEKFAWHPPSILKHRDSSEEKDNYHPGDLHSILKKSTSEDESTHSSNPDIRPILKNSSTEEESPLNAAKPRPILKKRTSFSDEFSYTSLSNDLKPILKKKIQIDFSEEQPKPILKLRRKSEEARSSEAVAASLGARPRANSADLNIKPILKNQQSTKGSTSASSSSVLINTSDSEN